MFVLENTSNLNGHLKNVHGDVLSGIVNTKVHSVELTEAQEHQETVDNPKPSTYKTNIGESTESSDTGNVKNVFQDTFMSLKTINESLAVLNSFK